MKKLLVSAIVIVIVILFLLFPKSDKNKYTASESPKSNFPFYKEENRKRYIIYKEKNKSLSDEDVWLQVNLNLDRPFYTSVSPAKFFNTSYVLVNKYNFLGNDYVPIGLVKLDRCCEKEIFLVKDARDNFLNMCSDMGKLGLKIRAISGYRTYSYQENLYNRYVLKDGVDLADTYSARPGFSEHQTGLVVDIDNEREYYENFEKTDEFKWLENNAYKYGFILRYPQKKESITGYSYESWHYRYVGNDIAYKIYKQNITFDEYYAKFIDINK